MGIVNIIAPKYRLIILALIALAASTFAFSYVLRIAKMKNIVDNPDYRKLQKTPVPVLGGVAVFFGIVMGVLFFKTTINYSTLLPVLGSMTIMLYLGVIDDILGIKAWKRMGLEILTACLLMFGLRDYICNFYGLWGLETISPAVGAVLTILTFAGVVNAINMIDGIDGLSTGFGILILCSYGLICFLAHDYSSAALCAVTCGALVPFLVHNVIGYKTKMFIGDGGTMLLGAIISSVVISILGKNFALFNQRPVFDGLGLVAFVVAVMSIPVADTLRVMFSRMAKGHSPFEPDKTHLHHMLVNCGFSFISITIIELLMDFIVILACVLAWRAGASAECQLYTVVILASIFDFVTYGVLSHIYGKNGKSLERLQRLTSRTHIERRGFWLVLQNIVDRKS